MLPHHLREITIVVLNMAMNIIEIVLLMFIVAVLIKIWRRI